jgi:hypothetical protein
MRLCSALAVNFPANVPPSDKLFRFRGFAIALGLVVAFKLWLVQTEDIYGSATAFDALWYLGSAKNWYWGSPYGWTAFVRPPSYPLFIALVHLCGIPLRIAIELLQMGSYLVLVGALRKAAVPRVVCLLVFAAMVLHPASFEFNDYTMSDCFYAAILPLAAGGLLLTLFTANLSHAIWTGVALAVLWTAREESFLIPVMLAAFVILALAQRHATTHSWSASVSYWMKPTGAMLGMLAVLLLAVNTANYRAFHSFAKSELTSSSFKGVYKALLRIKPSHDQRFISVSTEALEMAYRASPTFAQLKPQFEGDTGRTWQVPALTALGIHEIAAPWFLWALRNVTATTQDIHKSPVSANRFYRKAAREINRACDEGRIPCRFVLVSFLDPGTFAQLGYVPQSLGRMAALFVKARSKITAGDDAILTAPQRSLYDEMTGRRRFGQSTTPEKHGFFASLSITLENLIGNSYRFLVVALALGGLVAVLVIARYFRQFRISESLNAVLILLAVTIALRVTLFAFLDATWWTGDYERYIFPVMPLTSCFLILLIYQAIAIWRRRATV